MLLVMRAPADSSSRRPIHSQLFWRTPPPPPPPPTFPSPPPFPQNTEYFIVLLLLLLSNAGNKNIIERLNDPNFYPRICRSLASSIIHFFLSPWENRSHLPKGPSSIPLLGQFRYHALASIHNLLHITYSHLFTWSVQQILTLFLFSFLYHWKYYGCDQRLIAIASQEVDELLQILVSHSILFGNDNICTFLFELFLKR